MPLCQPHEKINGGDVYKAWRCYAAANHGTKKQDADGNEIGCNNSSINDRSLKTCRITVSLWFKENVIP